MSKTTTEQDRFFAAWPTAWGPMGGVWGESGLRRVILPHYQLNDLKALLAFEHPSAKADESPFAAVVQLCRDYFNGKPADFSAVPCELPAEDTLGGQVLRFIRTIPYGQTRSYHVVAELIGKPDAARAVAAALGKNNIPLVVPCHRVTYAGGKLGGFSAPGGADVKKRMLELERNH